MKRILEVKRGDAVPADAKWLKDIKKQTSTGQYWDDDGFAAGYVDYPIYTTFDVFEVIEMDKKND